MVTFVHSLAVTIIKLIRKNIRMNYTVRIKIEVAMQLLYTIVIPYSG